MLNDYKDIQAWSKRTGFLPKVLSSVAGYCVALVVRTLPNSLLHRKHNIRVKVTTPAAGRTTTTRSGWTTGGVTFVQKCHSNIDDDNNNNNNTRRLLFEGKVGILAAGTAPFYGGGLRLFPFARMTVDKMHLRLARISPVTGFFNIPRIFAGSYRDTSDQMGVLDFLGTDFEVTVRPAGRSSSNSNDNSGGDSESDSKQGFPLQHSGESVGEVEQFRLRVVEEPVKFVSFLKKRI